MGKVDYKKIVDDAVKNSTGGKYKSLLELENAIKEAEVEIENKKSVLSAYANLDNMTKEMEMVTKELNSRKKVLGEYDQLDKVRKELEEKQLLLDKEMKEVEIKSKCLIEEEIGKREVDRSLELKIEKVKTGNRRLDDLLLGGIPFGSNILLYGPPFTGKEITMNCFIAEGLKKGIPAIYVNTDKLVSEIQEEMSFVIPDLKGYEKRGLIRYVDAYSRSIGIKDKIDNVSYIADPTKWVDMLLAVDEIAKELLKDNKYYRLGLRSLSTLLTYTDEKETLKFLHEMTGKRKKERAVSMYAVEKGMHDEQDIQMIGGTMDGMIDYKIEQLKTFLSIRGIGDVQSRSWLDYNFSKQGLCIGSFSLDHIR